ncbi:MAG: class I SAM-dependent methyltransferase family protein [Candidatus Thermoplasmatota archaeon]
MHHALYDRAAGQWKGGASQVTLAQVPRQMAEETRQRLTEAGAVRRDLKIIEEGMVVQIPLSRGLGEAEIAQLREWGGETVLGKASPRKMRCTPFEEIAALLPLPAALKPLLPRKWHMIGDVLVLRLTPELDPYLAEIASTYARILGAKAVLRRKERVSGDYREPGVELICGSETETVHVENRVLFKFDPLRIMLSQGNVAERKRMAYASSPKEIVVDMFAGIGYFTLPMAKHSHPRMIVAYEINPLAYRYLVENIALNHLTNVTPVLGDCRDAEEGVADRVIMGYVGTTHEYLPKAFRILSARGGTIHYHETSPLTLWPDRAVQRIGEAAKREGWGISTVGTRVIKSYAPGVVHGAVDVEVRD